MVRRATREVVIGLIGTFVFFVVCINAAYATGYKKERCDDGSCNEQRQNQEQDQHQKQHQGQDQAQAQETTVETTAQGGDGGHGGAGGAGGDGYGGEATASNEGITVEGDQVENNSSNVVLVPNNNTESCLRVWGIAFGRNGESGALGIPWRSKKCDFEQAADDAFAAGERELGWFWKCQNPNLYKQFRDKDESKESAKQDCHERMVGSVTQAKTIRTLEERVQTLMDVRALDREQYKESLAFQEKLCNEATNRAHESCLRK